MSNIVEFPKTRVVREVLSSDEIEKAKERQTRKFADDIVNGIGEVLYQDIESSGVNTDGKDFDNDFSFLMETLRATVYRGLSLPHHFHKFIDENISIVKVDDYKKFIDDLIEARGNEDDEPTPTA